MGARESIGSLVVVACVAAAAGCSTARERTGPVAAGTPGVAPVTAAPLEPPEAAGDTLAGLLPRGSDRWRLGKPARDGQIEGFASSAGGPAGTTVRLRVSTDASSYRIRAFRLGYYRGGSGRQVWISPGLPGLRQRAPVLVDFERRTVEARWRPTATVHTSGWTPGVYVFLLETRSGWQAHVPYVVSSPDAAGRVALVAPVTTWQAYNDWGGYSLYTGPVGDMRSHAVSFRRPYPPPGSGELLYGVVPVVLAAERLGLPLAYFTNVDLHSDPSALEGAVAYVSMGHDEYWTTVMRRSVIGAREAGTNLVFLGANTMYWRIRLETHGGNAVRVVGYRSDAWGDPEVDRRPGRTTARFRDLPRPQPENDLTGMLYECFPVDAPWRVADPGWWGYRGARVREGTEFPHLVGVEADRVYPDRRTPRPLQVVAHVSYDCGGVPTSAQAVYYSTTSGAGVFNAGTLRWTCALSARCGRGLFDPRTREFARTVTENVLREFAAGPAGRRRAARDNVGRFHLPTVNAVPAS